MPRDQARFPQGRRAGLVFQVNGWRGEGSDARPRARGGLERGDDIGWTGEGSGDTSDADRGTDQALTRAEMARLLGTPSGRPDPAVRVLPPPKGPQAGDGKVMSTVRETGNMFATAFEALRQAPLKGVPVTEFFDQCWFLARVTTLPLILLSIPFGMVIALEVGSLLQQIGAQSQLGRPWCSPSSASRPRSPRRSSSPGPAGRLCVPTSAPGASATKSAQWR